MYDKFKKIEAIVENWTMSEADEEEDVTDKKTIKIFYKDLDMDGKQSVLEAIDASFDYVDVFSDDVVKDNIEEALSQRPLFSLTGEELVNKMDIEL